MKKKNVKAFVIAILIVIISMIAISLICRYFKNELEAVEVKASEAEPIEREIVMIYDVLSFDMEAGRITVQMPNGEFHDYYADDLPEDGISEVALATNNQDDYTTYRIVAIR